MQEIRISRKLKKVRNQKKVGIVKKLKLEKVGNLKKKEIRKCRKLEKV